MISDPVMRVWARVAEQSRGAPVTLAHVCAAMVVGVPVDGVGLTVMASPVVRETVHATNEVASALEELQLTLGQGPCVDTFTLDGPVLAPDLRAADCLARWPVFAPAAIDTGAGAVFAIPLQLGAIRWGAVDLYRGEPGSLSRQQVADALAFADAASMLLLDSAAGVPPEVAELAWQRADPTAREVQVHQATGMIAVQLSVNVETAFARLRGYAFAHERRLGDVARDVVERRLRFEPGGTTQA
jgi:ANTAR domain-containing protein